MVVFWLSTVFLSLSLMKDATAATWDINRSPLDTVKRLCELTSFQDGMNFTVTGDGRILCELRFPYNVPEEEQRQHCEFMHPSDPIHDNSRPDNRASCKYEIMYLCPPGRFPLGHLCIEFHEEEKNYSAAEEDCQRGGGQLPDAEFHGKTFLRYIINYLNPHKLGFSSHIFWLTGKERKLLVAGRGLAQYQLGATLPVDAKTRAAHFCLYESMKTQRLYEKECEIYKTQFKLAAHFHGGTCYTMSPSVSVQKKAAVLHERCQWFSAEDRAVSPMSNARLQGIYGALVGTAFEYNYITTTGEKDPKTPTKYETDGWAVTNVDAKQEQMVWGVWGGDRPKMKDGEAPNAQALAVPKPIKEQKRLGYFYDVPKFVRGHRICATGTTKKDLAFKACEQGWMQIPRDDGTVMCAKAWREGLANTTYDQAMAFCKKYEAVLAPMESQVEYTIITDMVKALNPPDGAMWIGARRDKPGGSKFIWELDKKEVTMGMGTNWHRTIYSKGKTVDEPNNLGGKEDCLQLYVSSDIDFNGKWNDIECTNPGQHGNTRVVIYGGVCAKYHMM